MNIRRPGHPVFRRHLFLATTVAALLVPVVASAANKTWDGGGGDSNWLTGANWDLDTAPGLNDALFFAGIVPPSPFNNFPAGTLFNGINFNAGAGSFNLTGNAITLSPGISAGAGTTSGGNITNSSANAETIGLAVSLAAGNHAITTAASSGVLTLSAALTRAVGATAVFNKTGGNINLTGTGLINDASGILGGWAVTNIGTNTGDWAALDGAGNVVAYTGYTVVAPGGTITSGTTQNIKITTAGANVVTSAGLTEVNTLLYSGTVANETVTIGAGNTLRLGSKGGIMITSGSTGSANKQFIIGAAAGQGILTAGGADNQPGEISLYNNAFAGTNNDLTINATITDNGSSAFPVSVNIMGYIVLATANTYSGGTFINQGRIQASNAASFGTGPVNVAAGAEAFLNNNGTYNNAFNLSGIGATEVSAAQQLGAIRMNTGGTTLAGTITLLDNARISGGSGGNNVITGRITGPGRLELTAATGNNGSINLNNSGTPNDWNGGLLITVGAATRQVYLKLLANEQIPDGPGKGDVTIAGASDIARFDLNGRSETINGLIGATSANNQVANLGAAASTLTLGNNNATATFGGTISDAGGANTLSIVKIGAGTQTFAGASTYTGSTLVNAGTLAVTGSLLSSGTVTVNADALTAGTLSGTGSVGNVTLAANNGANIPRLAPGVNGTAGNIGTLTLASLTVNGGDYPVDLAGTNDLINVTGTANFTAASTITPGSSAPNGTYTVLVAGTLTLGVAPTVIQPTDTRKTFTPDFSNPNAIMIVVGGASKTLNWTGSNGSAWDLNTTPNWNDGVAADNYFNGDQVNLLDGPANRTLTLTGITVSPAAVSVNNGIGNDYSIGGTGAIGGSATLTKDGAGTLVLTNNNTSSGATTIAAGILQIGNGGTSGSLGTGTVTNNATLAYNRSDNTTVANLISGSGGLTKTGNGVLSLSGANTYQGATAINTGSIKVNTSASLGAVPGGAVTVAAGATLDLSGSATANNLNFGQKLFSVAGTGVGGQGVIFNGSVGQLNAFQNVALTADATFGGSQRVDIRSVPTSALNATLDLAGHTLTKIGTNQFSLVGTNVTDGDIIVNAGVFSIETVTAIPDFGTGKKLTFNAGTTLQFFGNTAPISTVLRPMLINGAGFQMGNANNVNSVIGSPITLNADLTVTALAGTTAASTLTLTGVISEMSPHTLTKTGPSVLALFGNNTFTGGTTISAGTVQTASTAALGPTTAPLTVNGGTLDLFGNNITVGAFGGSGGTITSSVGSGPITFTVGTASDATFPGVIQNGAAGSLGLTKQGAGSLTLSGTSLYTGPTQVSAGTLVVNGNIFGSNFSVNGGTLKGTGSLGSLQLLSGTLAPGAGPGILNVGTTNLQGGTLAIEVGGSTPGNGAAFYDQLNITGFLEFDAPVALTLDFSGYNPADGTDSFVIINNEDVDDVLFLDDNSRLYYGGMRLDEGAHFTAASGAFTQEFSISYMGGTGNDVVLQALVPEPGSAIMLLGGLGVLAARRCRRQTLDTPSPAESSTGWGNPA